jgi:hypothetical protein
LEGGRNEAGGGQLAHARMPAQVILRNVPHLTGRDRERDASSPSSNGLAARSGEVYRVGDALNVANADISEVVITLRENLIAVLKTSALCCLDAAGEQQENGKSHG